VYWEEVSCILFYMDFEFSFEGMVGSVLIISSLAYFEIRSILVRVLWWFELDLEEESKDWIEQKEYSLWDKPSLWVKIREREREM
jgi:hypothetical protein